jgi:hypothetical protein
MRNLARSIPVGVALFLAAAAEADPPARVGRLSLVEGAVTLIDTRTDEPQTAPLNWPVTGGTAIVTARGARAEIRVGSTAVRLDGATDLEFVRLDDETTALHLREGTISVRVRDRETAERLTVETPHARVTLLGTGRYRFDTNPRAGTTTVTTFQGNAQVTFGGTAMSVPSGRRAEIGPHAGVEGVGAFADGFDDWTLARDRGDDLARSSRYVSPEMTGAEALDEHGDWRDTPEYGAVWYPRAVPVGWAPYRWGRWAWVEPWGWTWIDDAPWGFAPFHYGRWALVGGVWGWVPGVYVARPVFAPALVGWIGAPGWSVSVSIGAVSAVGWFPLAPREVFVPAYHCSTVYVRKVNATHVTHIHAPRHHAHRHVDRAVTVVPASAVTHGRRVDRSLARARHADLAVAAAPPAATVARPPQRSFAGRSTRDDDRGRPREASRPTPTQAAPAASAATPPQRDRGPIARPDSDRRREPSQDRSEVRAVERRAPVAQSTSNAAPVAPPAPTGVPPARPATERPVERGSPSPQSAPPAPSRAMAPRAPVAVRPEVTPRVERGPGNEGSRAGDPPRRLERRPEPTRIDRQVAPARPGAPQAGPPPSVPERRNASSMSRAAPPAILPQLSLPQSAPPRGDGGRGGERRGVERR